MNRLVIGAFAALAMSASAWGGAVYNFAGNIDSQYAGWHMVSIFNSSDGDYPLADMDTIFHEKQIPADTWAEYYSAIQGIVGPQGIGVINSDGSFDYTETYGFDHVDDYISFVLVENENWVPGGNYAITELAHGSDIDGKWQLGTLNVGLTSKFESDASAVPEPTSGMLLLIGIAGLALRRKRA